MSELLHEIVLLIREDKLPTKDEIMNMAEEDKEALELQQNEILYTFRQQAIAEVTLLKRRLIILNKRAVEFRTNLEKQKLDNINDKNNKKRLSSGSSSKNVRSVLTLSEIKDAKQITKTRKEPKKPILNPSKSDISLIPAKCKDQKISTRKQIINQLSQVNAYKSPPRQINKRLTK